MNGADRIYIVDDEELARDGLRSWISREYPDLNLCGEAGDGERALQEIVDLKPEIVLMDIRIPRMDGLEVAARIRETLPWVQIIIISGYDEFEYARRAMKLGISSYLLKPVEWEALKAALSEGRQKLRELKAEYEAAKTLENDSDLVREHFFTKLITTGAGEEEVRAFEQRYGERILAEKYVVCRMKPSRMTEDVFAKLYVLGKRMFADNEKTLWFIQGRESLICILRGGADDNLIDDCFRIAQIIQYDMKSSFDIDMLISIGDETESFRNLPRSYQTAREISELQISMNTWRILSREDCAEYMHPHVNAEDLEERQVLQALRSMNSGSDTDVSELFSYFGDGNIDSMLMRFYRLMQLLNAVRRETENPAVQEEIAALLPQRILEITASYENTVSFGRELIRRAGPFRSAVQDVTHTDIIRRARNYIHEHYADPDISLGVVAKAVGFSNNHFSTVFSQEMGKSFIEYLTEYRIERAKELLAAGQKTGDAGLQTGYVEPSYFSFVFKKTTGLSPRDYRKQLKPEAAASSGSGCRQP